MGGARRRSDRGRRERTAVSHRDRRRDAGRAKRSGRTSAGRRLSPASFGAVPRRARQGFGQWNSSRLNVRTARINASRRNMVTSRSRSHLRYGGRSRNHRGLWTGRLGQGIARSSTARLICSRSGPASPLVSGTCVSATRSATRGEAPSGPIRQRGVHTALLRHRLRLAAQAGAELVISGAAYGSASHRNQQRLGLQLAYVESTWARITGQHPVADRMKWR